MAWLAWVSFVPALRFCKWDLEASFALRNIGLAAIKYELCTGTAPASLDSLIRCGLLARVAGADGARYEVQGQGSVSADIAECLVFGAGGAAPDRPLLVRLACGPIGGAIERAERWLEEIRQAAHEGRPIEPAGLGEWLRDCSSVRLAVSRPFLGDDAGQRGYSVKEALQDTEAGVQP